MGKEDFSKNLEKVLNSKSTPTVQKVVAQKKIKILQKEKQVSFYIEKNLLKELKIKALEEGLNFKEIMTTAIQKYLE